MLSYFRSEGWRWYVFGVAPSLYQWPPEILHVFCRDPERNLHSTAVGRGPHPRYVPWSQGRLTLNQSNGFPFIFITSLGIFKSQEPLDLGKKKHVHLKKSGFCLHVLSLILRIKKCFSWLPGIQLWWKGGVGEFLPHRIPLGQHLEERRCFVQAFRHRARKDRELRAKRWDVASSMYMYHEFIWVWLMLIYLCIGYLYVYVYMSIYMYKV